MTLGRRFGRFLLVGGLATLAHYAILVALVHGGVLGPVAASSTGFAVSALLNYALNRRFTFRSERRHAAALPRFAAVAASGLALNTLLMWLIGGVLGLHYLLAQVLATAGTLLWNFCLHHLWTFSARHVTGHP